MNKTGSSLIVFTITIIYFSSHSVCVAILRGEPATPGEFKYAVIVASDLGSCTGSILNKESILTAASCVIDGNNEFVKGQIKVIAATHHDPPSVSYVKEIIVPWEFNGSMWPNTYEHLGGDIAVLKLANTSKLNLKDDDRLEKVKLSQEPQYNDNRPLKFVGFGVAELTGHVLENGTEYYESNGARKLRKAEMELAECSDLPEDTFCVKMYNPKVYWQGHCHGDEGGVLIREDQTIAGIASSILDKCDDRVVPSLITNVDYYKGLILDAMRESPLEWYRTAKANDQGYF